MTRRLRINDLGSIAVPEAPTISPDGTRVCYTLRTTDVSGDKDRRALWLVPTAGGSPTPLTRGTADSSPAWSPDGTRMAFLRRQGDTRQLWIIPVDGGEAEQLTTLPLGSGAPVWSPDGRRVAFAAPIHGIATPGDSPPAEPDNASPPHGTAPVVVRRLGYKADGDGVLRTMRTQLFVTDLTTGHTDQLTHGDWHVGHPAWSPDGERLAFCAAATPDADLTGTSAVFVVDAAAGAPARQVGGHDGRMVAVTWAPDGTHLVATGRPDGSAGHLFLISLRLSDGAAHHLTSQLDRNVMFGAPGYPGGLPQLTSDGAAVIFCARDRGCTHVYSVGSAGGRPTKLVGGADRVVSGLSVASAAQSAAVVITEANTFGEVATVDLATATVSVLTSHTRSALPDVEFLVPREHEFTISDGTRVHGWTIRETDEAVPGPLLVDLHGGPHNAWAPVPDPGHPYHQILAAAGWTVLLLNIRGSDGYGENFFTAALGRWGVGDELDVLEPVNQLVAAGLADPDRLAVTGYSYGGYLTCWLTGRTDRFAAAVAGASITDLTSVAGTSDVGHLLAIRETAALPHSDPSRLSEQSPYSNVSRVTTRTLLLHGEVDQRCPAGQAEQWFAALRARGITCELVLYPGSSHLFILTGRPSHRIDYARRVVDWVSGAQHEGG